MSKFLDAIRRLFSKKNDNSGSGSKDDKEPNEFQKAQPKAPRTYDEVVIGEKGASPQVKAGTNPENVQVAHRAPRPYDEVDVPQNAKDEGVAVK